MAGPHARAATFIHLQRLNVPVEVLRLGPGGDALDALGELEGRELARDRHSLHGMDPGREADCRNGRAGLDVFPADERRVQFHPRIGVLGLEDQANVAPVP